MHTTMLTALRLLILAGACAAPVAWADEYTDVSQLLRANKFSEALVKTDAFLSAKPADPQMRFFKGVIQRNMGKQTEAIVTFTKLTEDFPELPEPYNNLAVLYAGQNQFDKARAALEMAIRTNPSYATAHENLGDVYARLASQAYNKALQLDAANSAVPPKLALIRELFKPNGKPTASASSAPAVTAPALTSVASATAASATTKPPTPAATVPATAAAATAPAAPPKATASTGNAEADAQAAVRAWARAWASKDMTAYLGAYGKDFVSATKQSRSAWEQERRARIVGKSSITVTLENLNVAVHGDKATAKFLQLYRADALSVSSRKTLELVKQGDKWLIVHESTGS